MKEICFKAKRLCVGPVKDCPFRIGNPLFVLLFNYVRAKLGLIILSWKKNKCGLFALSPGRHKGLSKPACIIGNHAVCAIQNLLG